MADANKSLLGLLNGIVHHDYYHDVSMTDDMLKRELYPTATDDEFTLLVHKARGMIKVRKLLTEFVLFKQTLHCLASFYTSIQECINSFSKGSPKTRPYKRVDIDFEVSTTEESTINH